MAKCEVCDKEYDAKRATSKFCSGKCRKLAFQQNGKVSVPEVSVPKIQDTPEFSIPNFGQPDCECMHCKQAKTNGSKNILNHGPYKPAHLLGKGELNRVSLPGDADYDGVCNDAKYDSHRIAQA